VCPPEQGGARGPGIARQSPPGEKRSTQREGERGPGGMSREGVSRETGSGCHKPDGAREGEKGHLHVLTDRGEKKGIRFSKRKKKRRSCRLDDPYSAGGKKGGMAQYGPKDGREKNRSTGRGRGLSRIRGVKAWRISAKKKETRPAKKIKKQSPLSEAREKKEKASPIVGQPGPIIEEVTYKSS